MSPPRIAFNDFRNLSFQNDSEAMLRVLESGQLVLGDEVRAFESEWADHVGVPRSIGVGNGLDAIEIGLTAAGIGPGDEVITTPMTAVATVLGVIRAGAVPVLADINPRTALVDMDSVSRCLTPATRAVLVVHLYGQMRQVDHWADFCSSHDVVLVEDCAQAHDARYLGQGAGSWGLFGAYSFYPTKNLGAVGDAGAIVTADLELDVMARQLRNYGQVNRYEHAIRGLNSRLDEIQAAVLRGRLHTLPANTRRRREIAGVYRENLDNPYLELLSPPEDSENHVYHQFVVLTRHRMELQNYFERCGVQTLIHYPVPAHRQQSLRSLPRDPLGLAASELHAESCLSLPCSPHLGDEEVLRVVDAANRFRPQA